MRTLILATLLAATLSACGSSSDKPAASSSTPPTSATGSPTVAASSSDDSEAQLRTAVQAYSDAYLTGDADASWALLTARCQRRMSKAEWAGIVSQAADQYGTALPMKTFKAQVSGDLARVTYTYDVAEINQDAEPWAREGGRWHEDDC